MGRARIVDVVLVLAVFFFTLGMLGDERGPAHDAERTRDGLGVVLAAASALPLLVRRRDALGAFALSGLASVLINALGYPAGAPLGATVALFFVGRSPRDTRAGPRVIAVTVATLYVLHVAASWIGRDASPIVPLLLGALVWGGAWVAGDRVRQRRERMQEERATAERERRVAVAEERARIARDLHDSAGHALNVILVQSGAARLLAEKDPAQARAALETIESLARETVGEIDRMVRVLREDGAGEEVEPPLGLAALATLVRRHEGAGMVVDVTTKGDPRALSRAVDQAAYRIAQEALTNAARHGAGSAQLELTYGDAAVALSVTNETRGAAGYVEGHGIVGMRERAAMLGGRIEVSSAGGTFSVRAELPYRGAR